VLKLSLIHHEGRITIKLTGRLEGRHAEDLRLTVCPPSALDVDVSGVTSIDRNGERALVWLRDRGATLQGAERFADRLCSELPIEQSTLT
jgi:hypothetical protein